MLKLARLFGTGRDAHRYFECRHCGKPVDGPATRCPACDATEIASYSFDRFR